MRSYSVAQDSSQKPRGRLARPPIAARPRAPAPTRTHDRAHSARAQCRDVSAHEGASRAGRATQAPRALPKLAHPRFNPGTLPEGASPRVLLRSRRCSSHQVPTTRRTARTRLPPAPWALVPRGLLPFASMSRGGRSAARVVHRERLDVMRGRGWPAGGTPSG